MLVSTKNSIHWVAVYNPKVHTHIPTHWDNGMFLEEHSFVVDTMDVIGGETYRNIHHLMGGWLRVHCKPFGSVLMSPIHPVIEIEGKAILWGAGIP